MNPKRRHKLSSWTIPLVYAAAAVVVGQTFPRLEHYFLPGLVSTMSPSAAMTVGGAVASGMITLTGVVFSLVFVMIQFSATAYSPRLVLWVARDPVMSHALGMFNATFLYALTMIAWVDRTASGRVPFLSSWLVVLLLLGSMAMLIALIARLRLLQVGQMLIFTAGQGRQAIADLYEATTPLVLDREKVDQPQLPVTQTVRHSGRPQVIQAVHTATLVELATASDSVIEVMSAAGDTLLELTPVLRVRGARQPLDESALQSAIEIGDERTFEQDPKYALRLVVDIAIKALSPAINDPTTAVQALDQVEDLLLRLGRSPLERGAFADPTGKLRVLIPFPTWDDLLRLALDEIRSYGADSVQVMRRMKALIENLTSVLPVERRPALQHWERRLRGSIDRSFAGAEEKRDASVADRQGLGIAEQAASG